MGLAEITGHKKSCQKWPSGHHRTTLSGYIFATEARINNQKRLVKQQYLLHMSSQYGERWQSTIGKNLLSSNMSSRCLHNMVNFGPLAAEIGSGVWGTPTNFNRFCVLAALLHSTPAVSVSQTLRHWTDGTTYIQQGDHHDGQWPTFKRIIY